MQPAPTFNGKTIDTGRLSPSGFIDVPRQPPLVRANAASFQTTTGTLAAAGAKLAQVGAKFAESMAQARQVTTYENAQATTLKRLAEFETGLTGRQDSEKFETDFNALIQEINTDYEDIGDPVVYDALQKDLYKHYLERGIKVKGMAWKKEVDKGRASYFNNKTTLENLFATSDERTRQEITSRLVLSTTRNQQAGYLGAEEAVGEINKFLNRGDRIRAEQALRANPEKFDPDHFKYLAPEDRIKLSDHAIRLVEANRTERVRIQDKAEKAQAKLVKERQEDTARQLWTRVGTGDNPLTLPELDRANLGRTIPLDEYKAMKRVLTDEADQDDPYTVWYLTTQIEEGEAQKGDILKAMIDRQLTGKTGITLLNDYYDRQRADHPSKSPEYKDAVTYIRENLKSTGLMSAFDQAELPRMQTALSEFGDRIKAAQGKEGGESMREIRDNIVERFRPADETLKSLPRPMFGEKADPGEAYRLTKEAYKNKKIPYKVYRREVMYLARIEAAQDRMAAKAEKVDKDKHDKNKKDRKH